MMFVEPGAEPGLVEIWGLEPTYMYTTYTHALGRLDIRERPCSSSLFVASDKPDSPNRAAAETGRS